MGRAHKGLAVVYVSDQDVPISISLDVVYSSFSLVVYSCHWRFWRDLTSRRFWRLRFWLSRLPLRRLPFPLGLDIHPAPFEATELDQVLLMISPLCVMF